MKIISLSQESFLELSRAEHAHVHAEVDRQSLAQLVAGYLSRFCCEIQIDDKPAGAFGLIPGNIGVASAWALVSPELRERKVGLMRVSHKLLTYAFDHFKLHRLEATVAEDFQSGRDYVEALDFQYEGTKSSFGGPGKDFRMYARIQ